ncbi:MAG: methyltransferase type 11 [Frankiales bacterium]|nr:methyltransferase type 11 [Frankiales bacterium]
MHYANRAARALLGVTAHPGGLALTGHALVLAGLGAGDTVLDVACGDGATLRELEQRGAAALGVDVEPEAVARCRGRAVVGDAVALPVASGLFDGVLLECSLSTFDDPERALREAARVLKADGVLVLTDVVLDREAAPSDVVAAVDALTTARSVPEWTDLLERGGWHVTRTEDRRDDALTLVRRVRRRLLLARPRAALTAWACEKAVRAGSLSYVLLVAVRAPD